MFDAAQILRFGQDLIFNASTENHRIGARWLSRHLRGRNRVHVVGITDNHIDASVEVIDDGVPLLASQSIGMNVLSLDEHHVVVQDIQLPLIRNLERKGFTPVPVRWRHGRSLGGGFHCATLDIRRDSTPSFAL
jgi:glycine amidinotransferase